MGGGGWVGLQNKTLLLWGVWIFYGTAHNAFMLNELKYNIVKIDFNNIHVLFRFPGEKARSLRENFAGTV